MRKSENQLVLAARSGDQSANELLVQRYRGLAWSIAGKYYVPGGTREDLVQEAWIGFTKAIRDFTPGLGLFGSFASLCMRRQVISAVKRATRKKHEPLNHFATVFTNYNEGVGSELPLLELLTDSVSCSAEDTVVAHLEGIRIRQGLGRVLTSFEASVLNLRREGMPYDQIALQLERDSVKSVDNALQRVKKKAEIVLGAAN
jgi:RNA polymerase sporulation-specific sigma factor